MDVDDEDEGGGSIVRLMDDILGLGLLSFEGGGGATPSEPPPFSNPAPVLTVPSDPDPEADVVNTSSSTADWGCC